MMHSQINGASKGDHRPCTLAESILSHAAGRAVKPGDVIPVIVDMVMIHDSIAPTALRLMREELHGDTPFDSRKVALAIDHVAPAATVGIAEQQASLRKWAREHDLAYFFDAGEGIAHQLLIERRLAQPGRLIVGSDSHSTSYGAVASFGTGMGATDIALALSSGRTWLRVPETIRIMARGRFRAGVSAKDLALYVARRLGADGATYDCLEYHGLEHFSVGERTTLASMAVEVGAKAGMVVPEGLPTSYPIPDWLSWDQRAHCSAEWDVDLGEIDPQIAFPGRVDDVRSVEEALGTPLDVIYVGTCTNGRHADMVALDRELNGRTVAAGTRLIVVPASREEFGRALADGTIGRLSAAGATFGPPGCGACIGRHMGVLAPGETCLFTGNRNFVGRMGSPDARIFLGSPEVAGASAATGRISAPAQEVTV